MFFRYLIYIFLAYLFYRLVFEIIIPIYKTTRQVRKNFHDIQSHMQDHMKQQQQPRYQTSRADNKTSEKPEGDYIDFEEVK